MLLSDKLPLFNDGSFTKVKHDGVSEPALGGVDAPFFFGLLFVLGMWTMYRRRVVDALDREDITRHSQSGTGTVLYRYLYFTVPPRAHPSANYLLSRGVQG